jgi:hypothetical protein
MRSWRGPVHLPEEERSERGQVSDVLRIIIGLTFVELDTERRYTFDTQGCVPADYSPLCHAWRFDKGVHQAHGA